MKTHKLSKLIGKSDKRLMILARKQLRKVVRLETIIEDSKIFDVPLSVVTISDIEDKIAHYNKESFKMSDLWNFKYNNGYHGSLGHRSYKDAASIELVEELNKERNNERRIKNRKENIFTK